MMLFPKTTGNNSCYSNHYFLSSWYNNREVSEKREFSWVPRFSFVPWFLFFTSSLFILFLVLEFGQLFSSYSNSLFYFQSPYWPSVAFLLSPIWEQYFSPVLKKLGKPLRNTVTTWLFLQLLSPGRACWVPGYYEIQSTNLGGLF